MPASVPYTMKRVHTNLPKVLGPINIDPNIQQMLLVRHKAFTYNWQTIPIPRGTYVFFQPNFYEPCKRNVTAFRSAMVTVTGPLGTLRQRLCGDMAIIQNGHIAKHQVHWKTERERAMQCFTTVKCIKNMVYGVSCGWEKRIRLFGKGFKAAIHPDDPRKLQLRCGFARPMTFIAPQGISFEVLDPDDLGYPIVIRGVCIIQVGNVAASLRKAKKMNLQGQGIRYDGEARKVRTKKGKR